MKEKIFLIKTLETNKAYNKILHWFFSFPCKEISLNDIVKQLGISKTTANRIITKLIREGFIRREIIGKTWRLSCDIEHSYNRSKKICYNLNMIYESKIIAEIFTPRRKRRFKGTKNERRKRKS